MNINNINNMNNINNINIYKVTADDFDYDQYDSFIVAATSSAQAIQLVLSLFEGEVEENVNFDLVTSTVELIQPSQPVIILGSFNAS